MRKENAEPVRERDLEGGERVFRAGARPDPAEAMSFIDQHRDRFGVEPICRTLGWCVSSYDARKKRPPSARQQCDELLVSVIGQVHAGNYQAYGARRV